MSKNTPLVSGSNAPEVAIQVQTFLALLDQADSVKVEGQMLNGWNTSDACGDEENEVAHFNWSDGEGLCFAVTLTEAGIAEGHWKNDMFFCIDHEGNEVEISLQQHVAITPQKPHGQTNQDLAS